MKRKAATALDDSTNTPLRTLFEGSVILRKSLKQFSKLIHKRHARIPLDELADLASTVRPALTGKPGKD